MTSSPVTARCVDPADLRAANIVELLACLPDPRHRRGRRHRLEVVLVLALAAVAGGARSLTSIGEWAQDTGPQLLRRLKLPATIPCETTIRRVLEACDAGLFSLIVGAWMRLRWDALDGHKVVAVDGKTVRGACAAGERAPHLVSMFTHDTGLVLGQLRVDSKTNEIPAIRDLLGQTDLKGVMVTADALHTQTATAEFICARGGDFLLTVKKNQPTLYKELTGLPWQQVPACTTSEKGHGRKATRTLKALECPGWIRFPHASQVLQVRRTTTKNGKRSVELVYLICSRTMLQAQPATVAAWVQGHWGIENALHWVRDVTFDEDRSRVRTGNGAEIMSAIRNLAISLLRLHGYDNIAAALRHIARDTNRAIKLLLTT